MYKCEECGDLFKTEENCAEHEDRHKRTDKANEMLKKGYTLEEIQKACKLWLYVPLHLKNVNAHNCFTIKYLQGCNKPAYRIDCIYIDGEVRLWGCGSWNGYYGQKLALDSTELLEPHPKEELFIDKRYANRYK